MRPRMPLPPSRGGMERKSTKQRHRVRRDGGSDLTDGPRRRDEKRCSGATGHRRGCRHWHLRRSSSTCDERFDDERVVEGSAASRLLWWAPMPITAIPPDSAQRHLLLAAWKRQSPRGWYGFKPVSSYCTLRIKNVTAPWRRGSVLGS